ncbi:MAG: hypothetical protein JW760_05720 [Spirochaetales bacterium]|nr:hypothetical protein [Spirochaetales bacterium]
MEQTVLETGLKLTVQKEVGEKDTSKHYGSGTLGDVFSTPALVAMMIEASARLVDDHLEDSFISVGKMSQVTHEKPTLLGESVSVQVTVAEADRYHVVLEMEAFDETGLIGTGCHERMIVERDSFFRKAMERARRLENKDF